MHVYNITCDMAQCYNTCMFSKWKVNGSNLADDYFIEIIIFIFIHFNTISCITYHILLGKL